jgi:hypothetical protein
MILWTAPARGIEVLETGFVKLEQFKDVRPGNDDGV